MFTYTINIYIFIVIIKNKSVPKLLMMSFTMLIRETWLCSGCRNVMNSSMLRASGSLLAASDQAALSKSIFSCTEREILNMCMALKFESMYKHYIRTSTENTILYKNYNASDGLNMF